MEKSITAGLEEYIRTIPGMKEIDAKQCSPLVLAYVGDCVYDLIIKTMVVGRGNRPVHRLHEETSQYVQASAQSFMMRSMQEHLNEEEHGVYRRGRNARSVSPAKNQSITDYRRATGFEALIGHLYLTGQYRIRILLHAVKNTIHEQFHAGNLCRNHFSRNCVIRCLDPSHIFISCLYDLLYFR